MYLSPSGVACRFCIRVAALHSKAPLYVARRVEFALDSVKTRARSSSSSRRTARTDVRQRHESVVSMVCVLDHAAPDGFGSS